MTTAIEISAWIAVGMLIATAATMYWLRDPGE